MAARLETVLEAGEGRAWGRKPPDAAYRGVSTVVESAEAGVAMIQEMEIDFETGGH